MSFRKNSIIWRKYHNLTILDSKSYQNLRVYCRCNCWRDISCQLQSLKAGMRKSCWRCSKKDSFIDKFYKAISKYWDWTHTDMSLKEFKKKFYKKYKELSNKYWEYHIKISIKDKSKYFFWENVFLYPKGLIEVKKPNYSYYANKKVFARFLGISVHLLIYRIHRNPKDFWEIDLNNFY